MLRMMGKDHAENLKQLRVLWGENDDPKDAIRAFTGQSLSAVARRIGMRRTDLTMMLDPRDFRRKYLPERRILEAEYNLPAYCLDELLDVPAKPTTTDGGHSDCEEG